jgi:hypothetical protein
MQINMNIKTDMDCDTDIDMLKVYMHEILGFVFHFFSDHPILGKTRVQILKQNEITCKILPHNHKRSKRSENAVTKTTLNLTPRFRRQSSVKQRAFGENKEWSKISNIWANLKIFENVGYTVFCIK